MAAAMPAPAAGDQRRRRARWQELTRSECFELLATEHLGRVAIVDDRGPVIFPVNFVLDRHTVVFRTGAGTKLSAASLGRRVESRAAASENAPSLALTPRLSSAAA